MEKLGQLHADAQATGRWDLIVVDTPPSRSALDFLDAPERLSGFLDGRFIRLLLTPARGPGPADDGRARHRHRRADQDPRGADAARRADVRRPRSTPCSAGSGSGPRRPTSCCRPTVRRSWSSRPPSRTRCARRRSSWSGCARSGCRSRAWWSTGPARRRAAGSPRSRRSVAAERLRRGEHDGLTAGLLRLHADGSRIVARETRLRRRFTSAHPDVPTAVVPALSTDVHDLDGLRRVGELLSPPVLTGVRGRLRPDERRPDERVRPGRARGGGGDADAATWSSMAVSSRRRQEVTFGRRRSSARRSRSVIPPHTPHSMSLSSASARHSVRTGQPAHICLARFCAAPRTKSSSGRVSLHRALPAQSSFHIT